MKGRAHVLGFAAVVALAVACSSSPSGVAPGPAVVARMDFTRPEFYAAPFPSDDRRRSDGSIALDGFPNPDAIAMASQSLALLARDARGFATTAGVFFSLSDAIDPSRLPASYAESVALPAQVFLLNVDAASPEYRKPTPVSVAFEADGGPFGAPNLLSLVPLQGVPLRPSTLYAAVVLRGAAAPALGVAPAMTALLAGQKPDGMSDAAFASYQRAITALGPGAKDVAAMAAFTTDAPLDGMTRVVADLLARPRPAPTAFALTDTFPSYCVYSATLGMPDYQQGDPPFTSAGGDWAFDAAGNPVVQRTETARLVVTVPRAAMPAAGWPTTVFIRTGGGGDRPLVDRGVQPATGADAIAPGTGPAIELARAGYAGVEVDGPLGGLRATTSTNEDFTIFNVFNGAALRDNLRESAVELVLLAHVLDDVVVDAAGCPGASPSAKIDTSRLALMGHSMGASILPLALAFEPRYRAAVLSGAGGSWIENVMLKKLPIEVRPTLEIFLGLEARGRHLTDHDPVLSLVQWAAEPADAQVYASRIVREPPPGWAPRHVLMVQGIVDHYILPPIAAALSAPLGLDLAGPELDGANPETSAMLTLSQTFPFTGRAAIAYPVRGNANANGTTAVVVQVASDGVEDGHEVIFQTPAPKYQYRCFLASLLAGTPVVLDGAGKADGAPCE